MLLDSDYSFPGGKRSKIGMCISSVLGDSYLMLRIGRRFRYASSMKRSVSLARRLRIFLHMWKILSETSPQWMKKSVRRGTFSTPSTRPREPRSFVSTLRECSQESRSSRRLRDWRTLTLPQGRRRHALVTQRRTAGSPVRLLPNGLNQAPQQAL